MKITKLILITILFVISATMVFAAEEGVCRLGDANGNCIIDSPELSYLKTCVLGGTPFIAGGYSCNDIFDLDGDGFTGPLDLNLLKSIVLGNTPTLNGCPKEINIVYNTEMYLGENQDLNLSAISKNSYAPSLRKALGIEFNGNIYSTGTSGIATINYIPVSSGAQTLNFFIKGNLAKSCGDITKTIEIIVIKDNDRDGFDEGTDCDDNDADINPSATEICDSIDNDCNPATADGSGESWLNQATNCGVGACVSTGNFVCTAGAKTDTCAPAAPAAEICDALDNDCDGTADEGVLTTYYQDTDADNYGNIAVTQAACAAPAGYAASSIDCNDADPNVKPSAAEICDGIDNDCDGNTDNGLVFSVYYLDADADGYGSSSMSISNCSTAVPAGYSNLSADCNDADGGVKPGNAEVCGNSIDENCDGNIEACPSNDAPVVHHGGGGGGGYVPVVSRSSEAPAAAETPAASGEAGNEAASDQQQASEAVAETQGNRITGGAVSPLTGAAVGAGDNNSLGKAIGLLLFLTGAILLGLMGLGYFKKK